jgi:hypothetical protein
MITLTGQWHTRTKHLPYDDHLMIETCRSGGIYDQQDATNSQNLFLEMLYMFRAIIAHRQELGTVCAAVRCISVRFSLGPKHVEHF